MSLADKRKVHTFLTGQGLIVSKTKLDLARLFFDTPTD